MFDKYWNRAYTSDDVEKLRVLLLKPLELLSLTADKAMLWVAVHQVTLTSKGNLS